MSTTARDAAEIAANALGSIRNGRALPEEIAAAIRAAFPADPVSGEGRDETEHPKVITPGNALWALGLAEEEAKRLRAENAALRASLGAAEKSDPASVEPCRLDLSDEIEVTPEMIAAGEDVLLCELGGAVSSHWFPSELAKQVYQAMAALCPSRSARSPDR